eukprot:1142162-Pelagomonas_calceolata.AAC.1
MVGETARLIFWQGNDVWRYKGNLVKKLAQEATANHAINTVYYNDIDVTYIDAWRICSSKRKDMSNDPSPQQKQYHAHYGPMIIE